MFLNPASDQAEDQAETCNNGTQYPKPHGDGPFFPSEMFEMMVKRCDVKYFSAKAFFGGELENDGQGFDDKNEADEWQNHDGIGHHGNHTQGGAQ